MSLNFLLRILLIVFLILGVIFYFSGNYYEKKLKLLNSNLNKVKTEYSQSKEIYDNLNLFFDNSKYKNYIKTDYVLNSILENVLSEQEWIKKNTPNFDIYMTDFAVSLTGDSDTSVNKTEISIDNIGFKQDKFGVKTVKLVIKGKYYSYNKFKKWINTLPNSYTSIEKLSIKDNNFNIVLVVYGK